MATARYIVDGNIQTSSVGMRVYRQTSRPTLDEDDKMCIWIDTDDGDKPYLVLRVSASVYKMMDFYISG